MYTIGIKIHVVYDNITIIPVAHDMWKKTLEKI